MLALQMLKVGSKRFQFFHNVKTDGRELYDEDGNLVMVIDHSLNFTGPDGKVGDMHVEGENWFFYYGPIRTRFDTGIKRDRPGRSYCWENLENAEVAALKHYLERTMPKLADNFADTAGGACD